MTKSLAHEAAVHFVRAGLSVIPSDGEGSKQPIGYLLPKDAATGRHTWKPYQEERPTPDELRRWFAANGERAIAIVGGRVSGGVEVLDFDAPGLYPAFAELCERHAPGLLERLPLVETPSGGHHLYYRSEAVEGNQKLAEGWEDEAHRKRTTLVETRGEGGYVLAPPSKGYRMLRGKLTGIPVITPEERRLLLGLARSFHECDDEPPAKRGTAGEPERPGDAFNERGWPTCRVFLEKQGWKLLGRRAGGAEEWQRPEKDGRGLSATFGHVPGRFYVFSSNGHPFEPGRAYTPFAVYALLEHGGDFSAAAHALSRQGYGEGDSSPGSSREKGGARGRSSPAIGVLVSTVEREPIRWLWLGRLALGKLTILDGDPGVGKSTVYCDVAARLTTGRGLPDELQSEDNPDQAGSVVIVTCEDGIADTIRPRLEEAGADLTKCLVIQGVPEYDEEREAWTETVPTIPDHTPEIERAVQEMGACFVIVDPLFAHLSSGSNAHRDQDVRRALTPLAQMAERLGVAVLVVRHLNKMSGGNVLYRGGGSIGIIGAARLGMLLGRQPDDEEALVLASTKANIARKPGSLALRLESSPGDPAVAVVRWEGPSTLSAQDLLTMPGRTGSPAQDEAEAWLVEHLAGGDPRPARLMWELAEADGLKERTVRRALKTLGVVVERIGGIGGGGAWHWSLPAEKLPEGAANALRLPTHTNGSLSVMKEEASRENAEKPLSMSHSAKAAPPALRLPT